MSLSSLLIKDFVDSTNDSSSKSESNYLKGTIKIVGEKKYVKLDGSEVLTPISETVDVDEDDRVLVTVTNHQAIILGNFTYPPSARETEEALQKSEESLSKAESAQQHATEAISSAGDAIFEAKKGDREC